jgi:ParB family chromosome partitioning protein
MADTKSDGSGTKRTSASKAGGTARQAKPKRASRGPASARSTSASRSTSRSSGAKKPAASNGRAKSVPNARSSNSRATSSSNGAKRSAATSRSSAPAASSRSSNGHGIVDTVKQAATSAKGPAIAVGAAAAGIAGGIALKARTRRKTVLGVPIPKRLPSVDAKSLAKSVGEASTQFAKTSKSVSKDIERAGDQAERIGKILK